MKIYVIGSISQEREIEDVAIKYENMGCDVRYVKKESDDLKFDLIRNTFLHIESWADLIIVVPKSLNPLSFGYTQVQILRKGENYNGQKDLLCYGASEYSS